MEGSQEKDHSFLGNDTFPNLYIFYEGEYKSEYLARKKIYERLLKSEPSIELYLCNPLSHWAPVSST